MITEQMVAGGMDYDAYVAYVRNAVAEGRTTGQTQTPEYVEYTRVNLQRMKRVDKTIVLNEELVKLLANLKRHYFWFVLTEGWCGDAAQALPVLGAIAKRTSQITLRLLLRDDHPELMSRHLTNGARAIPKLICTGDDMQELFSWGPRPSALQDIVKELLAKGVTKEEKGLAAQAWYNKDQTASMQREFADLITIAENS